jgi:neutral peptidase B
MNLNKKVLTSGLAVVVSLGIFASPALADDTKIQMNDTYDTPSYIVENWEAPGKLSKEQIVKAYFEANSGDFQLNQDQNTSFEIKSQSADAETGTHHFRVNQEYKGIPVYGADQTVTLDEDNNVVSYFGEVIPNLDAENISVKANVSEEKAIAIFKDQLQDRIGKIQQFDGDIKIEPYIYEYKDDFYFTYLVTGSTTYPEVGFWHYFIDAANGETVDHFNAASNVTAFGTGVFGERRMFEAQEYDGMYRLFDETRGNGVVTYDADTGVNLDVLSINKMFRDGAAVDAHRNAQVTYDYFMDTFGRNSVDDNGQILISAVHVGNNWNNASWNGRQMSYGDGDGQRFHPLSAGLDVAAHEMSHGVIQHTANLVYRNESGALNESYADIFGAMVDRDNWLMGEAIMADGTAALRSLEDPASLIESRTQAPYPDHWDLRYTGNLDNGGVHINSSINNKAAYLVAEGGEHYGVEVEGVGRDATEQIYYRALDVYLTARSDFSMMRQAAVQAATDLFGSTSAEVAAVEAAYDAVGVE